MAGYTKNDLEFIRIDRRYKLWLYGMMLAAGSFCFAFVVNAYVQLKSDPPWVKVALQGIAAICYLIAPYWMIKRAGDRQKQLVEDTVARLSVIETWIDSQRQTSGLSQDGSDPEPGGKP